MSVVPTSPNTYEVSISPEHVESLAKRQITRMKEIKAKIRLKNEMLNDGLQADNEYSALQEKADAAKAQLKNRRADLIKTNDGLRQISIDIAEIKDEKKELQMSLFDTLATYVATTGSNEIEDDNGETHKIRKEYKLNKI